jgi:DNA-binding transcriptional LysR family regulator
MARSPELKLQQLQYLIAIAEHGGLRSAALALKVSAAAVSKGLQELENTAGTRLFERQAQGLQLTPAGRSLLMRARLIQVEVDNAMHDLSLARARTEIRLSVGITPWVSLSLLAPAMQRFIRMRPDVSLSLHDVFGSDYAGLRDGTMDMAIGLAPPNDSGNELSARPLFSYEHAIMCRRGHPCQNARTLEELKGQSWLLSHHIEQYKPPLRDFFQSIFSPPAPDTPMSAAASTPQGRVHFGRSMHMALELVCNSDLLTVVPWPVVESTRERFPIEALSLKEKLSESTTSYVTRKNTAGNGCIGDFIEAFMQTLSEEAATNKHVHQRVFRSMEIVRNSSKNASPQ